MLLTQLLDDRLIIYCPIVLGSSGSEVGVLMSRNDLMEISAHLDMPRCPLPAWSSTTGEDLDHSSNPPPTQRSFVHLDEAPRQFDGDGLLSDGHGTLERAASVTMLLHSGPRCVVICPFIPKQSVYQEADLLFDDWGSDNIFLNFIN